MPQNISKKGKIYYWSSLPGISLAYQLYEYVKEEKKLILFITSNENESYELVKSLSFFNNDKKIDILHFEDREILPYDYFSPNQATNSSRLGVLYKLQSIQQGICIVSISNLINKLPPKELINTECMVLSVGEDIGSISSFINKLIDAGYQHRDTVYDYGDYAVRGSIIDIYPLGSKNPYRIDLFDSEIHSIRTFDKDSQRSIVKIDKITVLPASEIKLDKVTIKNFRNSWSNEFTKRSSECPIYNDVVNGISFAGIESYLPMFYEVTGTVFDYISDKAIIATQPGIQKKLNETISYIYERYEQNNINATRPLLHPKKLYLSEDYLLSKFKNYPRLLISPSNHDFENKDHKDFNCTLNPKALIETDDKFSLNNICNIIKDDNFRNLFCVESIGRREVLLDKLKEENVSVEICDSWNSFLNFTDNSDKKNFITIGDFKIGATLKNEHIRLISESETFGINIKPKTTDSNNTKKLIESTINNLIELKIGSPIVHLENGIGRYLGLENIKTQTQDGYVNSEFLKLEYSGGDLLYVPVTSLHMVSRYMGGSDDNLVLNKLGSENWKKTKEKAIKNVKDVATELLDIYSRREASNGHEFSLNTSEFDSFSSEFPFEETEDQKNAIQAILNDMQKNISMDRLICGDVGFGKTEVAMRAAFISANSAKQVIILVPTTLLAQQHYKNFVDRFINWPFEIEYISRFKSKKEQDLILSKFQKGDIDILIGTHKLIQNNIKSHELGLVIVDEEHRFGVRQKEKLKAYCANVDYLAMTATPIPRTLNMAMSGIRDLSIITSPPAKRLSIKTFVHENENGLIKEAILREVQRGGQVFYLHNDVSTIEITKAKIQKLLPEITISIGHGQMPERELEQVMFDFYHKKSNLLLCSTIIETGIDIPNANTIIIDRADKFGLAQLHQLRGRVGRSYHQAYAYLLIPNKKSLNDKAEKRLSAIMESQDLGAGFMLASHDLEIRGAGNLLGDAQSGQMHSIGFSLYLDMLERAVKSLKSGKDINLAEPLDMLGEINLNIPAYIPETYLPDVNNRLIMYKRISNAKNTDEINNLKIEMIDRFGLLNQEINNLFEVMKIKIKTIALGIAKIKMNAKNGSIEFSSNTTVEPIKIVDLIQNRSEVYKMNGAKTLTYNEDLPESEQRISFINNLLDKFS